MIALWAAALPAKSLWYLTRGSGAVSLLLLTASVVLGVATTVGANAVVLPRFVVQGLHRNVSLLVTVFLVIHAATSVADSFVPLVWTDALVPLHADYRPVWTGLGALAADLLLALLITSLLRVRLGLRAWRLVHWTSYACWPIALVHSLGTGSDTRSAWMLLLAGACVAAVVGSVWWRLLVRRPDRTRSFGAALAASVLVPALIGTWMRSGPLKAEWGHGASADAVTTETTASPLDALVPGVRDTFRGTFSQSAGTGADPVTMQLDATLIADPSLTLAASLRGRRNGSGVAVETGTVSIGNGTDRMTGTVTEYAGGRVTAVITGADGRRLLVNLSVQFDAAAGTIRGSFAASAAGARA